MRKDSKTVIPYEDIDYEIRDLIRLINMVEGIETVESCCGHGKTPCQIWFKADNIECLTKFWHKYLYGNPNWHIILNMTDTEIDDGEWSTPTYLLETIFPDFYYTGLVIDNLTYSMNWLACREDIIQQKIDALKEVVEDGNGVPEVRI